MICMANSPESTPSTGDSQHQPPPSDPAGLGYTGPKAAAEVHPNFAGIHGFAKRTRAIYDFAGPSVFIIGVVCAFLKFVDFDIKQSLSDPSILRKIAAEARPMLVFNAEESFISDNGAAQFIKELKVTEWERGLTNKAPRHVHIEFTKYLQNSPILTDLSDFTVFVSSERGKGLSWAFDVNWGGIDSDRVPAKRLFRLELLP